MIAATMAGVHVLVVTTSDRSSWFELARASVSSFHPDAVVTPVLAEGRLLAAPVTGALLPQQLAVGPLRYADVVLSLGDRAASWAALPWIIDELLDVDAAGPLVVIADTVQLLAPIDELLEPLASGAAAARAAHHDRVSSLPWGGCLAGFVAFPDRHADLLTWWRSRTLAGLGNSDVRGAGADWLWRDLPVGGSVVAVTDPAVRLSAATTGELTLTCTDDDVLVDGEPLRLVDMDGLDPTRPWWFAPEGESPRRHVSDSPGLRRLTHLVAERLMSAGWIDGREGSLGAVPGVSVTPELREWYRSLLRPVLAGEGSLPPNPYVAGEVGAFLTLLEDPSDAPLTGISRHADLVMAHRADVRAAFPAVRWSGRDEFIRWMWTHGLAEGDAALGLLPDLAVPAAPQSADSRPRPFGVNLIGYLTGELGLGVAARRMQSALESAGVPVATISYDRTTSRQQQRSDRVLDAPYLFNLLVITPDQLPYFVEDVGPAFLTGHHNIGLWYWETDVLTDRQISSFRWVDEVWGATEYLCEVFRRYDRVPVRHVPVPLVFEDPQVVDGDRSRLGLDDRFTVLFSFDFLSVVERKNPLGLIEAFCRAFEPSDGARLILKGINGEMFPDKLEELLDAAADRPDIDVWDTYLSSRDRLALVALADCYASLHRSEGLGLTMAEAMALGTPVVATAYSGNLDFMDDTTALLVPCTEILIGEGHLYPADGHWASPDLDVAASHLRRLFEEPELGRRLGDVARSRLEQFSVDRAGDTVRRRLDEIGNRV